MPSGMRPKGQGVCERSQEAQRGPEKLLRTNNCLSQVRSRPETLWQRKAPCSSPFVKASAAVASWIEVQDRGAYARRRAGHSAVCSQRHYRRLAPVRCPAGTGGNSANREEELLLESTGGCGDGRLRASYPKVGSGKAVLRGMSLLSCCFSHAGRGLGLPADRRRVVPRFYSQRTGPIGPASGSAAALLGRFIVGSSADAGEMNGTQPEDTYEISLDNRSGHRARRHSKRNFAFR